ncbi:response regulator transcription factor [candidate division KSB1 bacterium]
MSFTIVLAEDEPQIARLTIFKLEKEGFTVIWEKDGRSAYESVKNNKPDLVLLDIMMPVMDGYQVLKKIKGEDDISGIPVIMLSAKGQERDVVKGIEMGAEDYIVKPFRPAELAARIKKILGA